MGEYAMPFEKAMWGFPTGAALALLPALRQRKGFDNSGPSYADRAARKAKKKMKARLEKKFQLI